MLFGKNLKSFVATNCNLYDIILNEGSGDAFYLINYVPASLTVTLSYNKFSQRKVAMTEIVKK